MVGSFGQQVSVERLLQIRYNSEEGGVLSLPELGVSQAHGAV